MRSHQLPPLPGGRECVWERGPGGEGPLGGGAPLPFGEGVWGTHERGVGGEGLFGGREGFSS
jgi:hypothetical protein